MTRFILHGGYTGEKNDLNAGFFAEISIYLPDGANILLVYFSRDKEEWQELFEEDKSRILERAGNKKLRFTLASSDNFIEQIKDANAVYMRGGETDKLLAVLKQNPEFEKSVQGKVVAGSSAGAYALARYYYSGSKGKVCEGLGLLPIRIICHFQSTILEQRGNALDEIKRYSQDLELVVLRDYEWRTITI